jgi:osmotically-inducible protein OsmY
MRPIIAALLLAAAGCATSPNLDQSLSDIGADAALKGVLFADRSHDYGDVDLTIYEGRLMLTGTMKSEEGHRKLIENAWKADGVDQVIDEVIVGDGASFGRGLEDARIDAALRAQLITDSDVKAGQFKASVSKGVVYLLGVTHSEADLNAALDIARSISGVDKVVSHVLVRPL